MIDFYTRNKNKVIGDLTSFIDNLINERNSLAEKLQSYNKDEHVAKLISENDRLRVNSLHIMSEQEAKDAKEFRREHYENCKSNIEYILSGTGIGMGVEVRCKRCGEIKNITDVSNW